MRRTLIHRKGFARGVAVTTAAVALAGVLGPVTAYAVPATATAAPAPTPAPPAAGSLAAKPQSLAPAVPQETTDAKATALSESSDVEKVRAVREIEVGEATDEWLMLTDKNFVFKVYDTINADKFPLTKAEAYRVYRIVVNQADAPDATAFIRTGVFDFAGRDRIAYADRQEAARQAKEARQKAAAWAEIPADAAMIDGTDQNFVYQVWRRSTGPKVKAGAGEAWGGDATAWKTFITTTIYSLHLEDQRDAIEKAKQEDAEKARILAAKLAKKNAVAVLAVTAPDAWSDLSDDNFIRQLLTLPELAQPRHIEITNAANAALRSTDPAVWKAFIDTGIYDADKRDAAREKAAREEADRQKVREIKAKAEQSRLRPRLVAAANAALAGTPADVTQFLAEGQYNTLAQALMTTTPTVKGWFVRSDGGDAWITPGTPSATAGEGKLGAATWKVVSGLADPACFSFESSGHVGSYLRQQDMRVKLHASDGSDQFKKDATWCPKAGLTGSGVSLESKALPGRFLRHINGSLWAANDSGANWWDGNLDVYKADATWNVVDPDPNITTPIMLRWYNDDAFRGFVGNPKAAEVVDGPVRFREFANATTYWSQATGAKYIWGPILEKYKASLGYKARLPIDDSWSTPSKPGAFQHFENGLSIYWSQSTGAHMVYGAIRDHWQKLGWENSYLGFPTTDESPAGNLRRSTFQFGNIDHDPSNGGRTWDYRV
ncbi:AbfB domain-containing protein [Amycolatopsis sp. NPDC059657]|uniref:AbfB domain-containing protein n=1 Tax=Amycolatopsis sp. NPDC059657 TaxID=3346899 RepID=UPI003673556C